MPSSNVKLNGLNNIMEPDILQGQTLVLNKNWMPVGTVTVKEALKMVYGEWVDEKNKTHPKAKIIDIETFQSYSWNDWSEVFKGEERRIRSASGKSYKVPEIIILTRYGKTHKKQLTFSRRNLFLRDGNTCQYCYKKFKTTDCSIDHVLPVSRGGPSSWTNCVICCLKCNQKKKNRTPEEAGMKLLKEPTKPTFNLDYFPDRPKSWEMFLGNKQEALDEAYWSVPLESENEVQ